MISWDIEWIIVFYTGILGMTVTRFVQNPGAPTSSHIFRDVDNGNLMAFFDFPEHGDAQVVRGIGAIQHVALKGSSDQYAAIISNLKK